MLGYDNKKTMQVNKLSNSTLGYQQTFLTNFRNMTGVTASNVVSFDVYPVPAPQISFSVVNVTNNSVSLNVSGNINGTGVLVIFAANPSANLNYLNNFNALYGKDDYGTYIVDGSSTYNRLRRQILLVVRAYFHQPPRQHSVHLPGCFGSRASE